MKLEIIHNKNATVLKLEGKLLGGPFLMEMSDALHKLIDEGKKNVVVDVGGVSMITSTGIGILISGYTTMKNAGGYFKLANVSDRAKGLLHVTNLDNIFEYYSSTKDAVNSFG